MPLGTSESGFRAEVEVEQALARGEHLLAVIDKHEHECLTGPAASEAAQRLSGSVSGHVSAASSSATAGNSNGSCKRRPRRQQHDADGTLRPSLGSCRPLECRDTALTADNKAALRREATEIIRQLAIRPVLPPLLQARLAARRDQITTFLGRYPDRP